VRASRIAVDTSLNEALELRYSWRTASRSILQNQRNTLFGYTQQALFLGRAERKKLSSKAPVAKAIDYSLKRWDAFTRFLDDGRFCMSNNAAERAVRGIAVGRRNWTFCGSDSGGRRAAAIYTLIETCKLNDIDAWAWLCDVLARIADHPIKKIAELLPWNWKTACKASAQAA